MKMPRWLVVIMLSASALAVLGAGVSWWVTWPERTAEAFFTAMRGRNWSLVDEFILEDPAGVSIAQLDLDNRDPPDRALPFTFQPRPRSVMDFLRARRAFEIEGTSCIEVQRGTVEITPTGLLLMMDVFMKPESSSP